MLIFDQLRRNDPKLRAVALMVLAGLGILLAGLWWVQIVSVREYRESLETQSYRTVRIPAVRGKIVDRHGAVLAENRATYNVSLYLEELRRAFDKAAAKLMAAQPDFARKVLAQEKKLGRRLTKLEKRELRTAYNQDKAALRQQARYQVASNVVFQIGQRLNQSVWLDPTNFERHYQTRLALPYPVLLNLDSTNIARFEEQSTSPIGVDLEVQSSRVYPFQTTAAHVLGSLRHDNSSVEGEEAFFSYRLPDYRGVTGIEYGFDKQLRGLAGAKSVMVNNFGYRQTETIWSPAEQGSNIVLTVDVLIQQAAEHALNAVFGPTTRGAVVVMDVRTGDILALASSPTFNPNAFVPSISKAEYQHISELQAEKNRATYENYMPGSIFKTVVGMAALEAGWDPEAMVHVLPNPNAPDKGHIMVGRRKIKDLAAPGDYNFRRALKESCNTYFITAGLRTGPERILRLAQRVHFGEQAGLPTRQDARGHLPTLDEIRYGWTDGNTANISIGQDPVWVTPLQVTILTAAIANGGKVLWPRLVDRIEPPDSVFGGQPTVFARGLVRDTLGVQPRTLKILHEAMLADTEDKDGTGVHVRDPDPLVGLRICAKTGTAQVQDEKNKNTGHTTWFASFAPYEQPRWAVVVMVEDGASGGGTCGPVAGRVYKAILDRERMGNAQDLAHAK